MTDYGLAVLKNSIFYYNFARLDGGDVSLYSCTIIIQLFSKGSSCYQESNCSHANSSALQDEVSSTGGCLSITGTARMFISDGKQ